MIESVATNANSSQYHPTYPAGRRRQRVQGLEIYGIFTTIFTWTKNRIDFCKISLRSFTRFHTPLKLGTKADTVLSSKCAMKGLLQGSERRGIPIVQGV